MECAASFIRRDSPKYAAALIADVKATARLLRQFPTRGRMVPECEDPAVREVFVREYRLIYEIRDQRVTLTKASRGSKTDDPFRTFHEWSSEADTKAYGKL